ncbi:MAG: hypothetical protein Q9195_002836 [Heterodermia aff. obscurata]
MRIREIERLKLRVEELEEQLQAREQYRPAEAASLPSPSLSCTISKESSPGDLDPLRKNGGDKRVWAGIYTSSAQSQLKQYYGPSSSFYFIGRMSAFLAMRLQQPQLNHNIQPTSASMAFASPAVLEDGPLKETDISTTGTAIAESLTATQEDYFLSLFWQSYHCIVQIIDEVEFREHYKSLWATPGKSRKPSALVDIVLALCMQYGVAFIPRHNTGAGHQVDVDASDATIAGRWLYRRSQTLLSAELESPSIITLQCHVFAAYYLCNASFQNMAHSILALAVRTAQILGLHLEPAEDMPRKDRELRKRLWWTLYAVESKTCMKLGRPWSAEISQVTCTLPADDHELALLSGSNFASAGDNVTWLTYTLLNTKLILAARAVYVAFYDKCADVLGASNHTSLYSNTQNLEECAQFLQSDMKCLQTWLQDLPHNLKTNRKGSGEPFSHDRSPLEVELFAPLWLQRQRVLLELLYHNLSMNLYRPFISFFTAGTSSLQFSERNAVMCVNHAITIADIMHQILAETDLLRGWYEAFQWQWNATLSLIGYILTYPQTPSTLSARQAIDKAVDVFEILGKNFAVAASAANVTRDLIAKADSLIQHFRENITSPASSSGNDILPLQHSESANLATNYAQDANNFLLADAEASAMYQNPFSDSLDLAFTIDSFNSFQPIFAGSTDMSSTWNYAQE